MYEARPCPTTRHACSQSTSRSKTTAQTRDAILSTSSSHGSCWTTRSCKSNKWLVCTSIQNQPVKWVPATSAAISIRIATYVDASKRDGSRTQKSRQESWLLNGSKPGIQFASSAWAIARTHTWADPNVGWLIGLIKICHSTTWRLYIRSSWHLTRVGQLSRPSYD